MKALDIHLDYNSPVPLYYQLQQEFFRLILEGKLKPGEKIPTEAELQKLLGTSRGTITRAMQALVQAGVVHRERSLGTFVQDIDNINSEINGTGLIPVSKCIEAANFSASAEILEIGREIPPIDMKKYLLTNNALPFIRRLYFADNDPVVLNQYFLSFSGNVEIDFSSLDGGSLYDYLRRKYRIKVIRGIRAMSASCADRHQAELLKINLGDPLLRVMGIDHDETEQNEIIGGFVSFYRPNLSILVKVQQAYPNWWMAFDGHMPSKKSDGHFPKNVSKELKR